MPPGGDTDERNVATTAEARAEATAPAAESDSTRSGAATDGFSDAATDTERGSEAEVEADGDSEVDAEAPPPPELSVPESDYYAVLGLAPTATAGEIHRAYRQLAKEWHPDRYLLAQPETRAAAEQRMRALNRAHATLGDPVRRRVYDYEHEPEAALRGAGAPSGWAGGMAPSYVRYGTMPRSTAPTSEPPRSVSTLDVGDFFGLLSLILALGIFSGSLRAAGGDGGFGPILGVLLGIAFFLVALVSFAHGALLVRAAEERYTGSHANGADEDYPWAWEGPFGDSARYRTPGATTQTEHAEDPEEAEAAARFDTLVDEALASIPPTFLDHMPNLVVDVAMEPTPEQMRSVHLGHGYTLFGLYSGVPLTAQGAGGVIPEHITIFRGPIERHCGDDPDRIRQQVRATVLHEVAHHFGIDHDEMPDWVK